MLDRESREEEQVSIGPHRDERRRQATTDTTTERRGNAASEAAGAYLLAGQASELERLQLQSRVWEPSGRRLLEEIGEGRGARALDVGCGALGWLGVLSEWVGPEGEVVGTDIDDAMLAAAGQSVLDTGLGNVALVKDDLFASQLEPASFDLVHARYEICPLGRGPEQMETYLRLARPGATIVLEDPDYASWHFNPPAPALEQLIALSEETFRRSGGDWEAGRKHHELMRSFGIEAHLRAEILALPPGHPYLRMIMQFAAALEPRMRSLITPEELQQLRDEGEAELRDPSRWGTTFALIQAWGRTAA
jgi:ubiquinone/menaquinone biosynthesis C-methylase UbiE